MLAEAESGRTAANANVAQAKRASVRVDISEPLFREMTSLLSAAQHGR
jgi:hypothetical protein